MTGANKPFYTKNKFGKHEYIDDQCKNNTCKYQKGKCRYDELVFYDAYLVQQVYVEQRKKAILNQKKWIKWKTYY